MLLGQFNHTSWIVDVFNIILTWSGKQLSSCVKSCCLVTQIAGLKTNLNWSGVSLQQRTKLYLYNLLIIHSSRKRNANKRTIAERVLYTSAGRVYNSKPVDLRFESSWKSTRNFHFTRLTCNFLAKVDQHFFFLSSASRAFDTDICKVWGLNPHVSLLWTLSSYSAAKALCSNFQWSLNPHKWSTQISSSARFVEQMVKFKGLRFESLWSLTLLGFFLYKRSMYTSAGGVSNSKIGRSEVWILMKVDWNFHFTCLTCNFLLKVDQHISISAQLVEHLIPILQSLRFESSCKFTLSFYSAVRVLCNDFEWGLNPHKCSTQISSSARHVEQMVKF